MKKTNTINLGSVIFHIEEDAYSQLHKYLTTIKKYFSSYEGVAEIVADIEGRIAEILQEKNIKIISNDHVDEIINIMGQPEDYGTDESGDDEQHDEPSRKKNKRRIYRHPDEKILGGVCGGMAAYFDLDPVLFRLGFFLTVFFGGFGLIAYLILWLIVPEAVTASDFLKMKGEPVTSESIGKTLAEKVEKTISPKNVNIFRSLLQKIGVVITFIFGFLGSLLRSLGLIIKPVFGISFLLLGLFFTLGISFIVLVLFGKFGFDHVLAFPINLLYSTVEFNPFIEVIALLSLLMLVAIPIFQFIYFGLRLLFGLAKQPNYIKGTTAAVWIIALLVTASFSMIGASQFSNIGHNKGSTVLDEIKSDTLKISIIENENFAWDDRKKRFRESDDGEYIMLSNMNFDVTRSSDSSYHLEIEKYARGRQFDEAKAMAGNIKYDFIAKENELFLNQFLFFPANDRYQFQEIDLTLRVPTNKSVYFEDKLKYFLWNVKNVHDMHDFQMVDHTWLMAIDGLTCLDCDY